VSLFPRYDGPPLIEQICGVENMTSAWRRVRSNIAVGARRRSAGIDAMTLRDFEANWTRHMVQLADELRTGTYRPLPPRRVAIPKPNGGERAIAILAVRDRVAQRAVQQVLQPLFEPFFLDCSYGSRPGIGAPAAIARVERYVEQGLTWVLDADIASFFDTIDQRILLSLVRQRIAEPLVLQLIAQWLRVGALHVAESAELTPGGKPHGGSVLLRRSRAAIERLIGADQQPTAPTLPHPLGDQLIDPASLDAWELDGVVAPALPRRSNLETMVWSALTLGKPALKGARMALPHLQRLGARRALLAGAAVAGVVAAWEVGLRMQDGLGRGTPQGGSLSPLLANIYLHPFDLALTSQGLRLVRFVDDFVVMCADADEARRALELVQRQVTVLRLALNAEKTRIVAYDDGLEFLGNAFAPQRRGPALGAGLTSFGEAEKLLQQVAAQARSGAKAASDKLRRKK
jgi:RNA-directed DNA polymerase